MVLEDKVSSLEPETLKAPPLPCATFDVKLQLVTVIIPSIKPRAPPSLAALEPKLQPVIVPVTALRKLIAPPIPDPVFRLKVQFTILTRVFESWKAPPSTPLNKR
jgi:hypothetical protein